MHLTPTPPTYCVLFKMAHHATPHLIQPRKLSWLYCRQKSADHERGSRGALVEPIDRIIFHGIEMSSGSANLAAATHGAYDSIWPPETNEIINTGLFCREAFSEISKVYRKILHIPGYYMLCHQEASA